MLRAKRGVFLVRSSITTESVGTAHVTLLLQCHTQHNTTHLLLFSFLYAKTHQNVIGSFLSSFLLYFLLPFCLSFSLLLCFCPLCGGAVYPSLTAAAHRSHF
ncbi:hypothetical protein V8G54_032049 [Vigna mungo]|uniref:Uncharacterized protein n=1 Tax=Vigna mungo TaxID=3915 RepID=A0AAQ3ML86_VIGMU